MNPMTLDAGGYALYSVMGVCVVFVALVLIMIMIKVLVAATTERKPAVQAESPAATTDAEPVLAPGTAGDLCLYDTDPRDAAMVMAIVADELKKPLNELRFISIREVK